jgi:protein-disulfide isomerase
LCCRASRKALACERYDVVSALMPRRSDRLTARAGEERQSDTAPDVELLVDVWGLDPVAFEQCLAGNKYEAIVQKDIEEGSRLGVNGTPTFFINGRPLVGAQPLAKFVELIDDELARTR